MVTWIVIAVVLFGLIVLVGVSLPLLGRLSTLRRAVLKLQRRQAEAMALQAGAAELQETVLEMQRRTETMQERLAVIKAGRAAPGGKHALRLD